MMKMKFKIEGLDCANCAAELERAIQKIEEIQTVTINFLTEKMEIEYREDQEKEQEIIKKLKKVIKKEEPDVTINKI